MKIKRYEHVDLDQFMIAGMKIMEWLPAELKQASIQEVIGYCRRRHDEIRKQQDLERARIRDEQTRASLRAAATFLNLDKDRTALLMDEYSHPAVALNCPICGSKFSASQFFNHHVKTAHKKAKDKKKVAVTLNGAPLTEPQKNKYEKKGQQIQERHVMGQLMIRKNQPKSAKAAPTDLRPDDSGRCERTLFDRSSSRRTMRATPYAV